MPVPTLITALSTTEASNSPPGGETPKDGDNYLRTLAAFIATLRDGSSTNGHTNPYLLLTGGTVSGALTVSGAATLNGAVTIGNAVGDTITIGGGSSKSATGNWVFAAPTGGGGHHRINTLAGGGGLGVNCTPVATISLRVEDAASSDVGLEWVRGSATLGVLQSFNRSASTYTNINLSGLSVALQASGVTALTVGTAGNVTVAAPTSGNTLTLNTVAGAQGFDVVGAAAFAATGRIQAVAGQVALLSIAGNAQTGTPFSIRQDNVGNAELLQAANARLDVFTNSTIRARWAATGGMTQFAPTSGVALTVNGLATGGLTCDVTANAIGVTLTSRVTNLDNTNVLSAARWHALVGGASGGDAQSTYEVNGVAAWAAGLDNSDSDAYVISATASLGISNRLRIGTAGNVEVFAPTSGVGFTGTGVAGSDAFVYNGGTSGSFRVNTTGVPYGTSLHNNAGAVTGTTNQYITSGTYTPTLTNNVNVAATTARACQWIRVGNVVTVSGNCDIDPTVAAPTFTALNISLPIASTFVSGNQAGGTGSDGGSADQNGAISGNTTTVTYAYSAKSAANITHNFSFTYVIL